MFFNSRTTKNEIIINTLLYILFNEMFFYLTTKNVIIINTLLPCFNLFV